MALRRESQIGPSIELGVQEEPGTMSKLADNEDYTRSNVNIEVVGATWIIALVVFLIIVVFSMV